MHVNCANRAISSKSVDRQPLSPSPRKLILQTGHLPAGPLGMRGRDEGGPSQFLPDGAAMVLFLGIVISLNAFLTY